MELFMTYAPAIFAAPDAKKAAVNLLRDLRAAHLAALLPGEVGVPSQFNLHTLDSVLHYVWKLTSEAFEHHRLDPDSRIILVHIHRSISGLRDALGISRKKKEAAAA
jgi:hypothetical protein